MAFLVGGANSAADTGYDIDNSLRFDQPSSHFLSTTFGSAGNRKTFTISLWCKLGVGDGSEISIMGAGGTSSGNPRSYFQFEPGALRIADNASGSAWKRIITNAKYRDHSAWYHIVATIDTTQGTEADRMKLYVNGTQITSLGTEAYPDQNADLNWNDATNHYVGAYPNNASYDFDGYLADFYFIDGTAYAPSDFGETDEDSGIWKPKDAKDDLTFGGNGFFLEFKQTGTGTNASGMGADTSGNDNHFASNNLAATDVTTDTPTNNFSTMNPITASQANKPTYSEGNCLVTNHASGDCSTLSTMGVENGKWYFEVKYEVAVSDAQNYPIIGWAKNGDNMDGDIVGTYTPDGTNYRGRVGSSVIANAFDGTAAADDILGFYLDIDNGTLIVHQNGSDFMNSGATNGLDFSSTTFDPDIGFFQVRYYSATAVDHSVQFNFGNPTFSISSGNADANGYGNFEYDPTLGGVNYHAVCTKNLAEYG
jgi:hypothetical protein